MAQNEADPQSDTLSADRMRLQAIDALPALVAFVDRRQRYRFANRAYAEWMAVEPSAIVGRRVSEILPTTLYRRLSPFIEKALGGESVRQFVPLLGPDGLTHDMEVQYISESEADGTVSGFYVFVQDVSEHKQVERRLAMKDAVTRTLSDAVTLEQAADPILQVVCQHAGCNVGALWHIDQKAGILRCSHVYSRSPQQKERFESASREWVFAKGEGILGQVWSSGAPVLIPDVQTEREFLRPGLVAGEGLHGMFAFPVILQGDVLGVMEFFTVRREQPDPTLIDTMAAVGGQLGQFIERRRAEEALRESENRLSTLADAVPALVWSAQADGTVDFYSRRHSEYAGLAQRDDRSWHWSPVVHPEDVEATVAAWNEAVRTGTAYEIEHRIERADGEFRWHLSRAVPVRSLEGEIVRWYGSATDIHGLKTAENSLRESESRLRATFEGVADAIVSRDRNGKVLDLNPAFAALHGFPDVGAARRGLAQLLDMFDFRREDGVALSQEELPSARAFAGEEVRNVEIQAYLRDTGDLCFIGSYNAVPIRDPSGEIVQAVVTIRDVTERRRTEERQRLLTREVDHRARNALAVVQAVMRLTKEDTVEGFSAAVQGRVETMVRSHTRLSEGQWQDVELRTILLDELKPYEQDRESAVLSGPEVSIMANAVQSISLVLHELTTNAAKYGALSTSRGRVHLDWYPLDSGGLKLIWSESGGPPVSPPTRQGFGSTVISGYTRQLGGAVEFQWEREGMRCILEFPAGTVGTAQNAKARAETGRRFEGLPPPSGGPKRVLLVEDEPLLAEALGNALQESGYRIVGPAATVDDAIRIIAEDTQLTAAVLDVNLGGRPTWPVADLLAARDVPYLFLTGYGDSAEVRARSAPLIQKPCTETEVVQALAWLLGSGGRRGAPT